MKKLFALVFMITFVSLFYVRYRDYAVVDELNDNGQRTAAEVVAENTTQNRGKRTTTLETILVYKFQVDGKSYQSRVEFIGTTGDMRNENGEIIVHYTQNDPEKHMLAKLIEQQKNNRDWGTLLFMASFVSLVIASAVTAGANALLRRKNARE